MCLTILDIVIVPGAGEDGERFVQYLQSCCLIRVGREGYFMGQYTADLGMADMVISLSAAES